MRLPCCLFFLSHVVFGFFLNVVMYYLKLKTFKLSSTKVELKYIIFKAEAITKYLLYTSPGMISEMKCKSILLLEESKQSCSRSCTCFQKYWIIGMTEVWFGFVSFVVQNGGERWTRTLVPGQLFSHRCWEFHHCLHLLHRTTILLHFTQELQEKIVGAVQKKVMAKVVEGIILLNFCRCRIYLSLFVPLQDSSGKIDSLS